jgi:hypothetical protein
MITKHKIDGREATVVYLTMAFVPTTEANAELIKIIYDDGEMKFAVPTSKIEEGKVIGFRDFLGEMATPVLFHSTDPSNAEQILKTKAFNLSSVQGTKSEFEKNRGKNYFLSTTRSKVGDYTIHNNSYSTGVTFELDGDFLNHNHKVVPADYWDSWWIKQREAGSRDRTRESEDRVLSDKPTIEMGKRINDVIKGVHVLWRSEKTDNDKMTGDDHREYNRLAPPVRQTLLRAKLLGIPTYVYDNPNDFILQNKHKAIPVHKIISQLKGPVYNGRFSQADPTTRGNFKGYRELYWKNRYADLSPNGRKMFSRIRYGASSTDLENLIHNYRSKPDYMKDIQYTQNVFKWSGSKTAKEFIDKMYDKWSKIQEEKEMKTFKDFINEDGAAVSAAPVNTAGGGGIAGIGVGVHGEPGVKRKKPPVIKRKLKEMVAPATAHNVKAEFDYINGFVHGYTGQESSKGNPHYLKGFTHGHETKANHKRDEAYEPVAASRHAVEAWKSYRIN